MSKSVVTSDIPWGAVYAYRRGDTIEDDAVSEHGWEDYVASADSKEAREAQGIEDEPEAEPAKVEPAKMAAPQPASVSTGKEK